MNIWRDNYCLENDYDSKTKLSIIFSTLHRYGKLNAQMLTKHTKAIRQNPVKQFYSFTCGAIRYIFEAIAQTNLL